MPSSGTVSFSVTRDDICKQAMYECGALGIGETMSDDDLQLCSFRLNMIVKQLMGTIDLAPGLKVWSRKDGFLFLSSLIGTYSLGPNTITVGQPYVSYGWASSFTATTLTATSTSNSFVFAAVAGPSGIVLALNDVAGVQMNDGTFAWGTVSTVVGNTVILNITNSKTASAGNVVYFYYAANQARRPLQLLTSVLRDTNSNDVPLWFYNLQDYESLPSKANVQNTGDPTTLYYQATLTNGTLRTDVAGAADTTKYIHMVYLSPIEDFNSATDTPDYPQEWYRPLVKTLAVDIAPSFSLPVTQDMIQAKAEALAIAGRSNPETSSMFFQPKNDDYMPWGQY